MGTIKVAIADDHKIFRKGVILSLRPFTNIKFVQEAENGDDLLGGLAASAPEVVLMDLRMPVMDGLEATRYCREVLKLCNLPIIAITAEIGAAIKEEAIKSGASHFLSKPAKAQEIISILRSLDINA